MAWVDDGNSVDNSAGTDIIAQRFSASGEFLNTEYRLNTANTIGNEGDFSLAADSKGGFYMAYLAETIGSNMSNIILQQYEGDGTPINGFNMIRTETTTGTLANPQVVVEQTVFGTAPNDGNQVFVTWEEPFNGSATDIDTLGTYVAPNLTSITSNFRVTPATINREAGHDAALLNNGNIVVAYEVNTGTTSGVGLRVTDPTGQIIATNTSDLPSINADVETFNPKVTAFGDGGLVVVD